MIAVSQGTTLGGDTIYHAYVQIDVHGDVPILKPALCVGGRSSFDIDEAIEYARLGLDALGKKVRKFRVGHATTIAVVRSKPPGRVVYGGLVYSHTHKRCRIFRSTGRDWLTDIEQVIAETRAAYNG
jgi:hypothetical protein